MFFKCYVLSFEQEWQKLNLNKFDLAHSGYLSHPSLLSEDRYFRGSLLSGLANTCGRIVAFQAIDIGLLRKNMSSCFGRVGRKQTPKT